MRQLRDKNLEDLAGEAVNDGGLAFEPRSLIHNAEDARLGGNPIQAAQLSTQAAQDGKPSKARCFCSLLGCD